MFVHMFILFNIYLRGLDGAQDSSAVNQALGTAGFTIDSSEVKLKIDHGKTARVLGSLYCQPRVRIHGDTCLEFCMHAT